MSQKVNEPKLQRYCRNNSHSAEKGARLEFVDILRSAISIRAALRSEIAEKNCQALAARSQAGQGVRLEFVDICRPDFLERTAVGGTVRANVNELKRDTS